jgi:hypothetical protein
MPSLSVRSSTPCQRDVVFIAKFWAFLLEICQQVVFNPLTGLTAVGVLPLIPQCIAFVYLLFQLLL